MIPGKTVNGSIPFNHTKRGGNKTNMIESAKLIGAGIATIGLTGAAIASGIIFGNLISSTSRNPTLKSELFTIAILGFSLTEAVGLFSLMMSFLILFAF